MILLFGGLPGLDEFFGGGGKELINSSKEFEGWYFNILFFVLIFTSLTEPIKLYLRENIGLKALNIVGLIAASTVYLSYGLLMLFMSQREDDKWLESASFIQKLYFSCDIIRMAGIFYIMLAFLVLFKGMKKYYIAKAAALKDPTGINYRGDPDHEFARGLDFSRLCAHWTQERIWRIAEPRFCFWASLVITLISPFIGFLLLLTSISFWVNEWYQVYYKTERAKQASIDMMNEIKKANEMYNFSSIDSHPPSYVSTD